MADPPGGAFTSGYLHIRANGVLANLGDVVTQGQAIATSGGTGRSTALHLHFHVQADSIDWGQSVTHTFGDDCEQPASGATATSDTSTCPGPGAGTLLKGASDGADHPRVASAQRPKARRSPGAGQTATAQSAASPSSGSTARDHWSLGSASGSVVRTSRWPRAGSPTSSSTWPCRASATSSTTNNGWVNGLTTWFGFRGRPDEFGEFFGRIQHGLTDLRVDRLDAEIGVLGAGGARRPGSITGRCPGYWFGTMGWGTLEYPEYGLNRMNEEQAQAWCAHRFGRGNAVMWMTGEPPAGAGLELPSVDFRAEPEAKAQPWRLGPTAWLTHQQRVTALSYRSADGRRSGRAGQVRPPRGLGHQRGGAIEAAVAGALILVPPGVTVARSFAVPVPDPPARTVEGRTVKPLRPAHGRPPHRLLIGNAGVTDINGAERTTVAVEGVTAR